MIMHEKRDRGIPITDKSMIDVLSVFASRRTR
jgi:hypothetical protein